MEVQIKNPELQLTKQAYFTKIAEIHKAGGSLKSAYEAVEKACEKAGYQSRYNSFESFKVVFSKRCKLFGALLT